MILDMKDITNITHRPSGLQHEDVLLSNMIREMEKNTAYPQCFLVWDSEFSRFKASGFRVLGFQGLGLFLGVGIGV